MRDCPVPDLSLRKCYNRNILYSGKMLDASFSTLKLVNQCFIYTVLVGSGSGAPETACYCLLASMIASGLQIKCESFDFVFNVRVLVRTSICTYILMYV